MTAFKYEFKQSRYAVIAWSAVLGGLLICLVPMMVIAVSKSQSFVSGAMEAVTDQVFMAAFNIDPATLSSPMGMYTYISTFITFAYTVFGCSMGLWLMNKEYADSTADFLYTKSVNRPVIYLSKMLAGMVSSIIVCAVYFLASWGSILICVEPEYDLTALVTIALAGLVLSWMYMAIGFLLAALLPSIRSNLLLSLGIAFVTFVIGAFARMTGSDLLGLLSPYTYFDSYDIWQKGGVSLLYLIIAAVVIIGCFTGGYLAFRRRDIHVDH